MQVFEVLVALLLAGTLLAAAARYCGAPYPALVALGGAALALFPGLPVLVLDPELAPTRSSISAGRNQAEQPGPVASPKANPERTSHQPFDPGRGIDQANPCRHQ